MKILPEAINAFGRISLSVLLCEKTRSGLQTWKSIGEKMFVCCAESVASGGIPVALAATPAEQPVSTGCTFCGPLVALCQKHLAGGGIKRLLNCAMFYLPKFPLVQDIKIAGIKTSVTLYCKIVSTGAGGCTGGRRHSQQDAQIIFEITDADIMSLLQLLIPNIKNAAQKTAIEFRR